MIQQEIDRLRRSGNFTEEQLQAAIKSSEAFVECVRNHTPETEQALEDAMQHFLVTTGGREFWELDPSEI
jgi:translation initiation factor 2 beta subunit (eIF-2beta)/eIF-5